MRFHIEDVLRLTADMYSFGFEGDILDRIIEADSSDNLSEFDLESVSAAKTQDLLPYEQFKARLFRQT